MAQVLHGGIQFCNDFPQHQKKWYQSSNTVVVLSVSNHEELQKFSKELKEKSVEHSCFYEPDLENELTAIALVPNPKNKKLCSKFKLAGAMKRD
jgi:peptidyl-tRNA hydrolase